MEIAVRKSFKFIPVLVAIVLVAGCGSSRKAVTTRPIEIGGMANATLAGDLLIGSQPTEQTLQELADAGYRSILTVRAPGEIDWDEQAKANEFGLTFNRIEMPNPVNEITDLQLEAFARFMENRNGPALLHCGSGNRAAGLWAAWLIEYEGVDVKDALELARKAGMRDSIAAAVERREEKRSIGCPEFADCAKR